jgi:hypothetical protein
MDEDRELGNETDGQRLEVIETNLSWCNLLLSGHVMERHLKAMIIIEMTPWRDIHDA